MGFPKCYRCGRNAVSTAGASEYWCSWCGRAFNPKDEGLLKYLLNRFYSILPNIIIITFWRTISSTKKPCIKCGRRTKEESGLKYTCYKCDFVGIICSRCFKPPRSNLTEGWAGQDVYIFTMRCPKCGYLGK